MLIFFFSGSSSCGTDAAFSTPSNGGASIRQCNDANVGMQYVYLRIRHFSLLTKMQHSVLLNVKIGRHGSLLVFIV